MSSNNKVLPDFLFETVARFPIHPGLGSGAAMTERWVYDAILDLVREGDVTLETGAGASTLFFASCLVARHHCFVPDLLEIERTKLAASAAKLSVEKVEFHLGSSADRLPRFHSPIDFALIDGCHGPFLPFLDFYFAVKNLRPGGHVIIDDIHLLAPKILFEFVRNESSVTVVRESKRAAILSLADTKFLDADWYTSSMRYKSEESILTPELLAKFDRFEPVGELSLTVGR